MKPYLCTDRAFAHRLSPLQRRVHQLEQLISASITLDVTGIPDSFSHRLDSRPGLSNANGINQNWKFSTSHGECVLNYKSALSAATAVYLSHLISNNKHNPRFLYDTVAKVAQK